MLQNKWRAGLRLAVILVLIAALVSACGKKDKSVAEYTNAAGEKVKVSEEQFDSFVNVSTFFNPLYLYYGADPVFRESMLKQLIAFDILGSRLQGEALETAKGKAEEEYNTLIEMFAQGEEGEAGLDESLKELNITRDDIKSYIHSYMLASEYLNTLVSNEDVRESYDAKIAENPNVFTVATVSHILFKTLADSAEEEPKYTDEEALAKANEVRELILGGADFAEMAKEWSDDTGSAVNGGMMEDINVNGFVENFKRATLELPLNEVSEPVNTEYGYHLIRVDERNDKSFEEVEPDLRNELLGERFAEFMETELDELISRISLPEAKES